MPSLNVLCQETNCYLIFGRGGVCYHTLSATLNVHRVISRGRRYR